MVMVMLELEELPLGEYGKVSIVYQQVGRLTGHQIPVRLTAVRSDRVRAEWRKSASCMGVRVLIWVPFLPPQHCSMRQLGAQ